MAKSPLNRSKKKQKLPKLLIAGLVIMAVTGMMLYGDYELLTSPGTVGVYSVLIIPAPGFLLGLCLFFVGLYQRRQ
jgi:hypothetical protein